MEEEKIITVDGIGKKTPDPEEGQPEGQVEESLSESNNNIESIELDLDRVREKTFNKELGFLVDKVISHESPDEGEEMEEEILDFEPPTIKESDLLQRFHNLFYRAINLMGLNYVNAGFNQFELSLDTVRDNLEDAVHDEMRAMNFDSYSVLFYDIDKGCFTPCINNIYNLKDENIIIDKNEDLYNSIDESSTGIMLGSRTIKNNIYLRKRFKTDEYKFSYYFLSLKNAAQKFFNETESGAARDIPGKSLFPVLIIQLYDHENQSAAAVFNKLRDRLSIHFIFLARKLIKKTQSRKTGSLKDFVDSVEYNLQLFRKDEDSCCYIIRCVNQLSKEILFIIKYLHTKLKQILSGSSVILRTEKDRFIIFLNRPEEKKLKKIIDDFNSIHNEVFVLEKFDIVSGDPGELFYA